MDTSTVISLAALIVSILALPTSYFVAVRQVKVGLDEYERRSKRHMLLVTANALQEFIDLFSIATEKCTGHNTAAIKANPQLIVPHLQEIDKFVRATGYSNGFLQPSTAWHPLHTLAWTPLRK
jgi:hypothetical protein